MIELDDHKLLAEFVREGSESAFSQIVARHVNLAYSTALRFTGNPHHAQEITQALFVILARKAWSFRHETVFGRLVVSNRATHSGELRERRDSPATPQRRGPAFL